MTRFFLPAVMLVFCLPGFVRAQSYVDGKIITTRQDTAACKMLRYKNRKQENLERFAVVQVHLADGTVKTYRPVDIAGYVKEGETFRSLCPGTDGYPPAGIFIRQVAAGRANLYHNPGYPSGGASYYFRKGDAGEFVAWDGVIVSRVERVNPQGGRGEQAANPYTIGGVYFRVTQNTDAFREYFGQYFAECPRVVNKLKARFYTDGDIKSVFDDYNDWAKSSK
jgi:hypothetical protein